MKTHDWHTNCALNSLLYALTNSANIVAEQIEATKLRNTIILGSNPGLVLEVYLILLT